MERAARAPLNGEPLLAAELTIAYARKTPSVDGVRLEIGRGEIVALAGESGAGKSSIALALLGLSRYRNAECRGSIRFDGQELMGLPERKWRELRGRRIAYVPQSALSHLNPALRIGMQMREAWRAHAPGDPSGRIEELMRDCGLTDAAGILSRFPSEISIGQAQRVLLVMALLHSPDLLIADEPLSALDLLTQVEISNLLRRAHQQRQLSMLYISHDLLSVAALSHRTAILRHGRLVEFGPTEEIFDCPRHPYTQALIAALPARPLFPAPALKR